MSDFVFIASYAVPRRPTTLRKERRERLCRYFNNRSKCEHVDVLVRLHQASHHSLVWKRLCTLRALYIHSRSERGRFLHSFRIDQRSIAGRGPFMSVYMRAVHVKTVAQPVDSPCAPEPRGLQALQTQQSLSYPQRAHSTRGHSARSMAGWRVTPRKCSSKSRRDNKIDAMSWVGRFLSPVLE